MNRYSIGLDFGTLSCRAVIVNVLNGAVLSSAACGYPHGVMTDRLPGGEPLPDGWALQHPQDYLDTMSSAVKEAVKESGVSPESIIGIGVDFTASTALPTTGDGTPLCMLDAFSGNKHAYVKLWKHHGSGKQVDLLNEAARIHGFDRLQYYGGCFSPESSLPRQLAVLQEAPEVYEAMDQWIEAGDWIVWRLTGKLQRGVSGAGIKEMYDYKTNTYPEKRFLKAVDPRLENLYTHKHASPLLPLGAKAGELTEQAAQWLGLPAGIAVASANMDGHVGAPIIGMKSPDCLMAVIGTSCGWFALSGESERKAIPGICCGVAHSMWPDMICYEAGQSCVGDMYQWLADNCVPAAYARKAEQEGVDLQRFLTRLAGLLEPGESGLLALGWFSGNRSPLSDSNLTGALLGLTLQTRPEEIYRALLESAAFGGRVIAENYAAAGIRAGQLIVTGGISRKNPLAMQIYADVLNLPVRVAASENGPAHGAALFGAVAAGEERGGWKTVREAADAMEQPFAASYLPIPKNVKVYDALYREYRRLFEAFGQDSSSVMKRVLEIRRGVHVGK